MKRRISGRALAGGGLALALAVAIGASLAPNLRGDPPGASPATLKRIAQKNDRAAMEAGARMRAESEAAARATDALRAAQERGRAKADEILAYESRNGHGDPTATPAVAQ